MMRTLILVLFAVLFTSCIGNQSDKIELSGVAADGYYGPPRSAASVTQVDIRRNQLILTGKYLQHVNVVRIKDNNGFQEYFDIEEKAPTTLVAKSRRNIMFAMGKVFELFIQDAYGRRKQIDESLYLRQRFASTLLL